MNTTTLIRTAQAIMAPGKGLLAMDESTHTCNERLAEAGIAQTPALRLAYRQLLVTAPGLHEGMSGVILHDETIRQALPAAHGREGESFVPYLVRSGIIAGIKVDLGTVNLAMFPHEKVTEGLDGLAVRVSEYADMGARFAKWRAVISIGDRLPTVGCIEANAHALARYAAICQDAGLVPIVEPEVVMDGGHDMDRCGAVTEELLHAVFGHLCTQRVCLEGLILKPNMVLSGLGAAESVGPDAVAQATLRCLRRAVPAAVAGIAFLSGGQSGVLATQHLNAICDRSRGVQPWPLTFSFARAIQHPVLETWAGKPENLPVAHRVLLERVRCNSAAQRGLYTLNMEASACERTAVSTERSLSARS